ncbi:Ribonuclease III protein [Rutstroemia sp. NJR-2017a BBW]|nr:Ribonuclease III protein [Rutstroemia sp. NJR-2017a BBW]
MASLEYIARLENIIDYKFRNCSLIQKALTAPGAEGNKKGNEEEQQQYEGNRKLAKVGESLIQLVVRKRELCEEKNSHGNTSEALKPAITKQHQTVRANAIGLDGNMKLNPRQRGIAEPHTLHLAMCAIVLDKQHSPVHPKSYKFYYYSSRRFDRHRNCILVSPNFHCFLSYTRIIAKEIIDDNPSIRAGSGTSSPKIFNNNRTSSTEFSNSPMSILEDAHSVENEASVSEGCFLNITEMEGASPAMFSLSQSPSIQPSTRTPSRATVTSHQVTMTDDRRTPSCSMRFHESINEALVGENEGSSKPSSLIGESSNELQAMSITNLESPISAHNPASVPKKRKLSSNTLKSSKPTQLLSYITSEKRRCQASGIPFSETEFDLAFNKISKISLTAVELVTLKALYFAIGSPESLVALQEVLKAQRMTAEGKVPKGSRDLSLTERIRVIECITPNIAYHILQKRCHIYQLFVDSNVGSRKTSDGFIIDTMESIPAQPRSQIGNPNNLEDSRVSTLILKELYPGLKPNTEEYRKKKRFVGSLRRLGGRFDSLVRRFGYGVLGLIPLPVDELAGEAAVVIKDELILSISDPIFASFLLCLDHLQGEYLRAISNTVSKIVTALFHNTLDPSTVYGLEQVEPSKLLENGRGSYGLVNLISQSQF